eukprot:336667-Chlamydomonas_euryale.AAC.1
MLPSDACPCVLASCSGLAAPGHVSDEPDSPYLIAASTDHPYAKKAFVRTRMGCRGRRLTRRARS